MKAVSRAHKPGETGTGGHRKVYSCRIVIAERIHPMPARYKLFPVMILLLGIITGISSAKLPILGVFEGITPCSAIDRPIPQIPPDAECEMMIWSLALYDTISAGTSTQY